MQTVLITGVSGGIGHAIAEKFLKEGYYVIGISHKNPESGDSLQAISPHYLNLSYDLSQFENAHLLIEEIHSRKLTVDFLINNAGISVVGLLQDLTEKDWNRIWNTNVTSAVALSREVIPDFLRKQHGKILNISSVWGTSGASCEVAYSATKGAINTFTKALAKELAPSNIQVNALACGIIDTKMNAHLTPEDLLDIQEEIPAGRIGTPEDVAEAAFSILTGSSYITGQIIAVDGGWTV